MENRKFVGTIINVGCGGCYALYFIVADTETKCYNRTHDLRYGRRNGMEINVEDNFTLLFDKNNNTAYKALQTLQKADVSIYADSMQSLVYKDIQNSLAEIENL